MVPSISFSGRECRHADKIFAFPARTEFSVTTTSDTCSCASTLRCLGFAMPPLYVTIPNMLQPGTNILLSREIRHHSVCEFQFDLPVKGIDQIILGLEVRKQSSLCDASLF